MDVRIGVRHRHQPLLVQSRRQEDAVAHHVDPVGVGELEIGLLVVAEVAHTVGHVGDASLGAEFHRVGRETVLVDDRLAAGDEPFVLGDRHPRRLFRADLRQHGLRSGGHEGVTVEGALMGYRSVRDEFHDLGAAAESGDRHAAADRLGQTAEVGGHRVDGGGAAPVGGDAGLDLVEDDEGAVLVADLLGGGQIALIGEHDAHVLRHRLEDEGGYRAGVLLEGPFQLAQVVEGDDDDFVGRGLRGAAVVGNGVGAVGGAGVLERRTHRHHDQVVVPVVPALEFDHQVATGVAAGEPHGVHGGLRARIGEAHHVEGEALHQSLGHLGDQHRGSGVERSASGLFADGLHHGGVGVAGEERAVAHVVVNELVAVDIPQPAAERVVGDDGVGIEELEVAGHSERKDLLGPLGGLLASRRHGRVTSLLALCYHLGILRDRAHALLLVSPVDPLLTGAFSGTRHWCTSLTFQGTSIVLMRVTPGMLPTTSLTKACRSSLSRAYTWMLRSRSPVL